MIVMMQVYTANADSDQVNTCSTKQHNRVKTIGNYGKSQFHNSQHQQAVNRIITNQNGKNMVEIHGSSNIKLGKQIYSNNNSNY